MLAALALGVLAANVGCAIADTWVELVMRRNQKLTRDDLTFFMQKVEHYTSVQAPNLGSAIVHRPGGSVVAVGQGRNFWDEQAAFSTLTYSKLRVRLVQLWSKKRAPEKATSMPFFSTLVPVRVSA